VGVRMLTGVASETRTKTSDACWAACASGLPRIWYAAHGLASNATLTLGQKYVKGKPCKPYNSTLGEFFRVRDTLGLGTTAHD
jgi:hypothetical protein